MTDKQKSTAELERVIRKIKHCLALSHSSNENEAATSLRQAQALMRKHRLTAEEVMASEVGEVESSQTRAERRPVWDRNLSSIVAGVFSCKGLRHRYWCEVKRRRVEAAIFVGVSPAQHIALYAYETLLAKVTQARKEYVTGVRAGRYRSAYSPQTAGDHFAIAWVLEVRSKLRELVPKGEEDPTLEHSATGKSLAVLAEQDKALIEQYLSGQEIGKARAQRPFELDLDAQIAGMLAGAKVQLHAGLATGSRQQLQIGNA